MITTGHSFEGLDLKITLRGAYMIQSESLRVGIENTYDTSLGIKNLFDKEPPLSLRTSGGGHQVGYEPRYVDQLGRTFYLKASYTI